MKRIDHTLTYPDASVAEVYAMLTDPDYRTAVSVFQHVTDFSCQITPQGAGARSDRAGARHRPHPLDGAEARRPGDPVPPARVVGVARRRGHRGDRAGQAR